MEAAWDCLFSKWITIKLKHTGRKYYINSNSAYRYFEDLAAHFSAQRFQSLTFRYETGTAGTVQGDDAPVCWLHDWQRSLSAARLCSDAPADSNLWVCSMTRYTLAKKHWSTDDPNSSVPCICLLLMQTRVSLCVCRTLLCPSTSALLIYALYKYSKMYNNSH